jgi:hypothetical protein
MGNRDLREGTTISKGMNKVIKEGWEGADSGVGGFGYSNFWRISAL